MIKVNLLDNIALAKGAAVETYNVVTPEGARMGVAKIIVVLIFPLVLYVYERLNLNTLEENLHDLQENIQKLNQQRAKFGDAAPIIEKYNKEKARVDKELEGVRAIARARLKEVKTLDAIQGLMPEDTWAKKISIDGDTVRLEGYTKRPDGVSELIRLIDSNIYFSRVEPKFTSEENLASGSAKKFELDFRIGKQEGETVPK